MKLLHLFIFSILISTICEAQDDALYQSGDFTVFQDRVVQGDYEARAIDRKHISSDYQSPARTNYSSTITFKFSINGKDNEAESGQDHRLTIIPRNGGYTSPVIEFGSKDPESFVVDTAAPDLPPNTSATFRVDLSDVHRQFKEKGYYTTYDGEKIPASDFKGVYIAGGAAPLSWDFDNLHKNPGYKLRDENEDGIYETTIVLNPHNPEKERDKRWELRHKIDNYPSYHSDQLLVDALYNMSLDETKMLIESDSTFRTGAKWEGVWTRDISYSVLLAYAFIEPDIARKSLLRKVKRNRIIQDTGSGGAWPVSTDRVVWSLAAWEIFKVTGERDWLQYAYVIIENSVKDDIKTVYNDNISMFKGESSFLDWREQSYPSWMDNVDISQSFNLGTNVIYYRVFEILSLMAEELGKNEKGQFYADFGSKIKKAINENLWNEEKGYFNQYLYGRHYLNGSPRFESLGESLSILFEVADEEKSRQMVSRAPSVSYGIPTIYPQIPNIPPYHNNSIWPFVQSYWNWAVSKTDNEEALLHGLSSLYRSAALFVTNKENFVAENGDFVGTQINSDRQLWSVAGNLAMVYRVFLGMHFETDKIILDPTVPENYGGTKRIHNFSYRNAILDFKIEGFGNEIKEMAIDGKVVGKNEIPADLKGNHSVNITLNTDFPQKEDYGIEENKFSPPAPIVEVQDNSLHWDNIEGATSYAIYRNGKVVEKKSRPGYAIPANNYGQYKVRAENKQGLNSFFSEPVSYYTPDRKTIVEIESFAEPVVQQDLINYTGEGVAEITRQKNVKLEIPVRIDEIGQYLVSFRYSNGSGPWNTDNKCAVRTLYVDDEKAGTLVMAQRGKEEWSNWGMSNQILLELNKGTHYFQILFEPSNENMNGNINRALIDHMKIVRID